MGMYVCSCACRFSRKLCFRLMGCNIFIIDELKLWMILLFYEICVVERPGECESQVWIKCIYICNAITYDINVDDNVNMRWCWCWWGYWDEMMLMLIRILRWDDVDVDADNDIEMRWCWCWWCHCDVYCVCTWEVQWPCWISLQGEIKWLKSFEQP